MQLNSRLLGRAALALCAGVLVSQFEPPISSAAIAMRFRCRSMTEATPLGRRFFGVASLLSPVRNRIPWAAPSVDARKREET